MREDRLVRMLWGELGEQEGRFYFIDDELTETLMEVYEYVMDLVI